MRALFALDINEELSEAEANLLFNFYEHEVNAKLDIEKKWDCWWKEGLQQHAVIKRIMWEQDWNFELPQIMVDGGPKSVGEK